MSEWISQALLENNAGVKDMIDVDNNNKEF